ncbi:CD109 antigen-like protein [Labeo rohita]|uniref:CD109 antigen-like protein n=1 Tax=Labeo rohita TaxID=84645 RepID=A0A498NKB8_LABRO|nr:CD109 antigen-like protein [Labeo rohita]
MEWLQVFGGLAYLLLCSGNVTTPSPAENPSYLISVSQVLRCGVPTPLSVTVLADYPIKVTAELIHGNSSVAQTERTIPAGSTSLLALPPVFQNDMSYWYPYQLHVKGFVGANQVFSNSTTMVFSPKCMSIFIQTDKNNYQPGQTVKFRIVSVTPEGKPYTGQIDIFIRDPKGNMIRQWLSVDGFLGVISKDLNLSQNPPHGQWKIVAGVSDAVHERVFTVDYYVLPKFEVKVDVPSVVHYEDVITGMVTAQYFHGKPVSGKMSVTYVHFFSGLEKHYQLKETIDGSAAITFDVPYSKGFADYTYYDAYGPSEYVDIIVNVTDVTGLTYNTSVRVTVVKNKYNLEFLQHPQFIKPSMTFTAQLKLSTYDNRPLSAEEQSGIVRLAVTQSKYSPWTWMWNTDESLGPRMNGTPTSTFFPIYDIPVENIDLPVTADGVMSFQVHLTDSVTTLDIEAQFEDTVQRLQVYRSYSSPSKSYIQLHRDSEPQVGQPLYLTLESNLNLTEFHYLVSLSWSQDYAEPADSVSLSVSVSEPGSLVGILVVDKAALDLSKDNGITEKTEQNMYHSSARVYGYCFILQTCGVTVLTDAKLNQEMNQLFPVLPGAENFLNQMDSGGFQEPRQRKDFPETWIWLDANVSNSALDSFQFIVPDSLTSWVAFAIVMSENLGLGISAPAELTVSRDFFVTLNLPAFLIRGELLLLEVNLFNYMDVDLEVMVVVAESSMFEFVSPDNGGFSLDNVRKVLVLSDILGPSIGNLDSLIEMPYGCGEQNMIHFAPNIYVLQYMRITKQTDEQTRNKAMSYMMEAYERELSYQRFDGSFSAFGDSDNSGSTWLSAFVLRCFLQAQDFISIDPMVMQRTTYWLLAHQNADGSFNEPGRVIHTELQGGLDGPVSLTAYVLIALLEDAEYRSTYEGSISLAVSFLTSRLVQEISSNYSLSLVTYALSLANSTAAPPTLTELLNRALIVDGVPTWKSPGDVLYNSWQPRSSDIEISAYVLLAMNRLRLMDEGFSLVKWLSKQRNHLGGYGSTQDTIMALHALSIYATFSSAESIDLSITVNSAFGTANRFKIDRYNYLLQQSQDLPIEAEKGVDIEVVAEGKGFALFQLSVFYNVMNLRTSLRRRDTHSDEAFYLYIDVMDNEEFSVNLHICFRLKEDQSLKQTGMAILDVGLLTGFSLAPGGVQLNDIVRRVETPSGRVILYLDTVTTVESCVDISTILDFKVVNVQDAVIMIYDYYEPRRRTVRSYTSETRRDMSVCSLCGPDCSQCGVRDIWTTDGSLSINQYPLLALCLTAALIILLSIYN